MITLMLNVYAEDPTPAIESAREWLPIDREVVLQGRYEGFAELSGPYSGGQVWPSEHAKRNAMLAVSGSPSPDRWLFWLDCDERVTYASPQIGEQLRRSTEDLAGFRFIEPLPPDLALIPGAQDPRRRFRDREIHNFAARLYRHLPELEYRHRHDNLYAGDRLLSGWRTPAEKDGIPTEIVDLIVVHHWWEQPQDRRDAKRLYYGGSLRAAETASA